MKRDSETYNISSKMEIPHVVPELILSRIDDTLQNLQPKKRSGRFARKTILILVATLIILSIGTLVTLGQDLPLLNSLVKYVNPAASRYYNSVKVDVTDNNETSTNSSGKNILNKKATDQGITLTVNDLAYDGASLIVGFEVSKPGGFGNAVKEIDIDLLPSFQNPGGSPPLSPANIAADSYLTLKDNGDFQGMAAFYFGEYAATIQMNDTLSLIASNISVVDSRSGFSEINGSWKIDTGLAKKDIYTAALSAESAVVHPIKNGKVDSVQIIRSALDNIIILKGSYNMPTANSQPFQGFFILDDKGNCLNYKYILQNGAFKSVISLLKIPSDAQKLTVIPYTTIKGSNRQYAAGITKLPVSIKMHNQTINISDIDRSKGKLIMHYTISGLVDNREFTFFEFEDKEGNKINPLSPPVRIMAPMDYETGQGTYEFKTNQPEAVAKVIVNGQDYNLENDHKFDVELKYKRLSVIK